MVVRKRGKKAKVLGQRTHGHGNTKNRRGLGSRGGHGRAGSHKHKFSKYWMTFSGKKAMKAQGSQEGINLGDLQRLLPGWIESKKVEKAGESWVLDGEKLGFQKILGRGELKEKMEFKNVLFSKQAREKLGLPEAQPVPAKKNVPEKKV